MIRVLLLPTDVEGRVEVCLDQDCLSAYWDSGGVGVEGGGSASSANGRHSKPVLQRVQDAKKLGAKQSLAATPPFRETWAQIVYLVDACRAGLPLCI